MSRRAVDVDFGKDRKTHAIVDLARRGNFVGTARFLLAELVARKAQHDKPTLPVLQIESLQPRILRRKTAPARRIDDENDLAGEIAHRYRLAAQADGTELVKPVHETLS